MCGIAGYIGLNSKNLLNKMTQIISHRGPDDDGVYLEEAVGLGHRRLSVIDLSCHGHQPMTDKDGRAVIVYNGEVYNFLEIKKELLDMGYKFYSKTDTEVILNSYIAWGEQCLYRFNGMFSFVIWDRRKKTLLLARDRVGIKPLYYARHNNTLLFGSEIKSILCHNSIKREVNTRALDYFFTFRYNHLHETLFQGIYKLPPGYIIKVSFENDRRLNFVIRQYWDVSFDGVSVSADKKVVQSEVAQRIRKSVDYMMVSDVPLGTFLSSGVDSSTITAIMKNELGKPTNTFTVGFGYPGFEDELQPVRYTVDYFKTNHTEYICKPDMISLLPKIIWNTDELNADPALIPTYLISEVAKRKVKVVLSGEGADELFGGYERTMMMNYAWRFSSFSPQLVSMVPQLAAIMPMGLLDKFFKYSSSIGSKGLERLSSFCRNIRNVGASYLDVACVFNQQEKGSLYGPLMQARLKDENIAETLNSEYFSSAITDGEELFTQLSYLELKTRLPNDLLAKVDTMTMAHSLEARVPYLDHTLVDYALSLPANLKLRYMREKYILRKAALQYLPLEIVKRRKDHFFVPIHLWLQNELKTNMDKIFCRKNIMKTGYLNPDYIENAHMNYKKGALFFARQLWNVLFFLVWHKIYIETDLFLTMGSDPITLESLYEG